MTEPHAGCRAEDHLEAESSPAVDDRVLQRAASLFRALGDPGRLRVLERLTYGECCVTELAAGSREELSTMSQRLRVLRAEGLVSRRRDGKHIFYRLADGHVEELIRNALAHSGEA